MHCKNLEMELWKDVKDFLAVIGLCRKRNKFCHLTYEAQT